MKNDIATVQDVDARLARSATSGTTSSRNMWVCASVAAVLVLIVVAFAAPLSRVLGVEPKSAGFSIAEALFAGFAFIGLIVTLFMQQRELSFQRQELELTRNEMAAGRDVAELQQQELEVQANQLKEQTTAMHLNTFLSILAGMNRQIDDAREQLVRVVNDGRGERHGPDCAAWWVETAMDRPIRQDGAAGGPADLQMPYGLTRNSQAYIAAMRASINAEKDVSADEEWFEHRIKRAAIVNQFFGNSWYSQLAQLIILRFKFINDFNLDRNARSLQLRIALASISADERRLLFIWSLVPKYCNASWKLDGKKIPPDHDLLWSCGVFDSPLYEPDRPMQRLQRLSEQWYQRANPQAFELAQILANGTM
jgi:hypothetical protein